MSLVTLKIFFIRKKNFIGKKNFVPSDLRVGVLEPINYNSDGFDAHAGLGTHAFTADDFGVVSGETLDKG
jgi:hypothetical protein